MEPAPHTPECTGRPGSVYPGCTCSTHLQRLAQTRSTVYRGDPYRIPPEDGWAVVAWAVRRGWSPAALASATGLDVARAGILLRAWRDGHPGRLYNETCRLLLAMGEPTAGRVGMLGSTRRVRGLYRMGWTPVGLRGRYGVSLVSLGRIVRGGTVQVAAFVAVDIAVMAERARFTVGPSADAARDAARRGWAPLSAWDGLDIDDPGVTLARYPRGDRPGLRER